MKLRTKILLILLTVISVSVVVTSMVGEMISENIIGEQIRLHLEDVGASRAHHVETFLDKEEKIALKLAESIVIERLLISKKTDGDYKSELDDITERLEHTANIRDIPHKQRRLYDKSRKVRK